MNNKCTNSHGGIYSQRGYRFQKRAFLYYLLKWWNAIKSISVEGFQDPEVVDFKITTQEEIPISSHLSASSIYFQAKAGYSLQENPSSLKEGIKDSMEEFSNMSLESDAAILFVIEEIAQYPTTKLKGYFEELRQSKKNETLAKINNELGTDLEKSFARKICVETHIDNELEANINKSFNDLYFYIPENRDKHSFLEDKYPVRSSLIYSFLSQYIEDASCGEDPICWEGLHRLLEKIFKINMEFDYYKNGKKYKDLPWTQADTWKYEIRSSRKIKKPANTLDIIETQNDYGN